MDYLLRQIALRQRLASLKVDALLIHNPADVRYLCGFTGSNAALVISAEKTALFTDGRYAVQVKDEVHATRVVIVRASAQAEAVVFLEKVALRCGVDAATTTLAWLSLIKKARTKGSRLQFVAIESAVAAQRMRKSPDELRSMRSAAQLGSRLFAELAPHLRSGTRESDLAAQLEMRARQSGADKMSFETIIASGLRSARAHGVASQARLPRRGFVVLDFGVILNGYCSDMTRTVFLGKANRIERSAFEAVLEAQQSAIALVRPGVSCAEVDEAARSVLRRVGLAKYFTHSTGHGVGLEIHEAPRVGRGQQQILEPGMVVTIEPGVYLEGRFGIRIEDMVHVTATGHEILTDAPKGWMTCSA